MPKMKKQCPHCEQSFKNGAGLSAHVRAFHKDEKPPEGVAEKLSVKTGTFQCDQCEKPFDTDNGLKIHKVRMHPAKKVKTRQHEQPVAVNINHCPCCGFNLKLLAHAMATIGSLQNG